MKKLENCIVFSEDIKLIMEGNNALNYRFSDKGIIIPLLVSRISRPFKCFS